MPIETIPGGPAPVMDVTAGFSTGRIQSEAQARNKSPQGNSTANHAARTPNASGARNKVNAEEQASNRQMQAREAALQSERTKLSSQMGRPGPQQQTTSAESNKSPMTSPIHNTQSKQQRLEKIDINRIESQNTIKQQLAVAGAGGRIAGNVTNAGGAVGGRVDIIV